MTTRRQTQTAMLLLLLLLHRTADEVQLFALSDDECFEDNDSDRDSNYELDYVKPDSGDSDNTEIYHYNEHICGVDRLDQLMSQCARFRALVRSTSEALQNMKNSETCDRVFQSVISQCQELGVEVLCAARSMLTLPYRHIPNEMWADQPVWETMSSMVLHRVSDQFTEELIQGPATQHDAG